MKHSKTAILVSIFLSNHIFAAPTVDSTTYDPNYHLHELDSECNHNSSDSNCNPYGLGTQSIYGELNNVNGKKQSEKIDILVEYTKELMQNVYLLQKQANSTSISAADAISNIEKTLNTHSSEIAHQGSQIKENIENLSNFSLDTTEQLAEITTKLQQNNLKFLPVNYSGQSFYLDEINIMKQLDNKLQALHQNIYRLDKKMNAGFASQAALSGLFQPDANNTVNFTASVGGYHTQVALAVGMGYRFSKNVATRAGIAVNPNSRLTYNTAINFAW
ncbi:YadA C-terminal domain-containing protein [Pasteurella canis]|uniref:Trimeric autotransporter adhesin YadA-like C-terminal membrane anchor domain-containing protein n=1 Tax=Pasteurella canis TaxID=753 RepID=A0ABQ4VHJ1_9PAST|nr:YadA C-terminal domain-containing protein [Pasteurella canis]MXN88882.1 hypothetical protein [Pasteurella canis]UEC22982.1 YadA-like family protein [Pasteurella canis]GJH43481.1 hypothetical protein PA42_16550 [Pasteurella canis]